MAMNVGQQIEGLLSKIRKLVEPAPPAWQVLRFTLHLAAVYLFVSFGTPWLSGRTYDALRFLKNPPDSSSLEFLFSHLLAFSFIPAFLMAFIYGQKFRHSVALFIWVVPVTILAYKFLTLPTSVLESHFGIAFQRYFGGDFNIPEFYDYEQLFRLIGSNADLRRGMEQLRYTAPAYASVGYGLGMWFSMRVKIPNLLTRTPPSLAKNSDLAKTTTSVPVEERNSL